MSDTRTAVHVTPETRKFLEHVAELKLPVHPAKRDDHPPVTLSAAANWSIQYAKKRLDALARDRKKSKKK